MFLARVMMTASAVILFSTGGHAQDRGPSYSCSTAELLSERTICDNRRLSRLDRRMAELYEAAREGTSRYRDRRRLRREQFDWLSQRNACENGRRCLRNSYEDRIAVLEALAGGGTGTAEYGDGPSFDCSQARRGAETRICRSRRLSRLDQEMAELFRDARDQTNGWRARRRLNRDQKNWLTRRNDCRRDRGCLRDAYETRIAYLKRRYRDDSPAYQRTAVWRQYCPQVGHAAGRTTCNSKELWRLNRKMSGAYDRTLAWADDAGVRNYIVDDQKRWNASWRACGANERCQRRSYRNRTVELEDKAYRLKQRRRRTPREPVQDDDYRNTAAWRQYCPRVGHAAGRATCDSKRLWQLNRKMSRAYDRTLAWADGVGVRQYIVEDQKRWHSSWRSCGANERCQKRAYRDRAAELEDKAYRLVHRRRLDTAAWRQYCPRVGHAAGRTTCDSKRLWQLNRKMSRAYDRTLAWADGAGVRQYIVEDQKRWHSSWRSCGANERCQKRAYRDRTVELEDKAYRLKHRRRIASREPVQDDDYRRTAKWRSTCRSVSHPAGIATCNTRNLWQLNQRMSEAYQSVLASVSNPVVRARVAQDNVRWNSSWRSCGGNVQCQKQSYRQRISELNDPGYGRRMVPANGGTRKLSREIRQRNNAVEPER